MSSTSISLSSLVSGTRASTSPGVRTNRTCSGHSQPRTHRGHDAKFPGMAITYALMQRLEELSETEPHRVQIIKKARVTGLTKEGNSILGVTYEFDGQNKTLEGPVV